MGVLGHYLEEEGIATTQISLVREHTEKIKPPRALWVPFELGRPFGAPIALFQTKVLISALQLLEAQEGPILSNFPEDAPISDAISSQIFCPVSFVIPIAEMNSYDQMLEALRKEVAEMCIWHNQSFIRSGRTTADVTGLKPEEIVKFFASFISGNREVSPVKGLSTATALRMAAEDLKAVYLEGLSAQPGATLDSTTFANWFWGETIAAKVINAIREICLGLPDNDFQLLGKLLLVPRMQLHRFR